MKKTGSIVIGAIWSCLTTMTCAAPSTDCQMAREASRDIMTHIKACKNPSWNKACVPNRAESTTIKRTVQKLSRKVCPRGTFDDEDFANLALIGIDIAGYCPSIIGVWNMVWDYHCDDVGHRPTKVTFHSNSTGSFRGRNVGTWIQKNCSVEMTDKSMNPPVIWSGTMEDNYHLSGSYTNGNKINGCWTATPDNCFSCSNGK